MTIQFQASAVGLSWQALCEALRGRAQMQEALFKLSNQNTAIQLQMTTLSADETLKELTDQANGQLAAGIGQIVGAVATAGSTVAMTARQNYLNDQASLVGKNQETEIDVKAVNNVDDVEMQPLSVADKGNAEVEGSLLESDSDAPAAKKAAKKEGDEPKLTIAEENQKNLLLRNARFYDTHSSVLSSAANSLFSAPGTLVQSQYTKSQAEHKASETLQAGLAGIMKSQNDMLNAAIQGNDNYSRDIENAITTIISASAVRG